MRVLVIEDEEQIRMIVRKALEAEHFAVDTADDGERGSYLARTNGYDAIILNNRLPKKSGLEVCQEVRASGKTTPILILSVRYDRAVKIELLNAGADDYLAKPFSTEELIADIRALLRRSHSLTGDTLQSDDLVLRTREHRVTRGDREIELTRKEFALLEYLMRNKGAVLTRGMILEHVWDMNADLFSNTIEAHIASLRRKINFKGTRKLIKTVSGVGYGI